MQLSCKYGCGEAAIFGDRCKPHYTSCAANKAKNSDGAKRAWLSKKPYYHALPEETKKRMAWSKGKTKHNNASIAKSASLMKGVRKLTDQQKLRKVIYNEQCRFNINHCIQKVLGFELLKQFGMYHKTANTNGVVRDHRFSVAAGFDKGISPSVISHPANCRFLRAKDNSRKSRSSEITIEQLMKEITQWDSCK